eukprot:TRINITY_DN6103_c0_g1_i3.p1 TRINITY_DN6103_c0_g1~~TRINITY_DN6103_c0_g1_i3.p1  ORF type:complete len:298 (+),score=71.61 TRINITY_DN6103_c0_g1_i3:31-894(+)
MVSLFQVIGFLLLLAGIFTFISEYIVPRIKGLFATPPVPADVVGSTRTLDRERMSHVDKTQTETETIALEKENERQMKIAQKAEKEWEKLRNKYPRGHVLGRLSSPGDAQMEVEKTAHKREKQEQERKAKKKEEEAAKLRLRRPAGHTLNELSGGRYIPPEDDATQDRRLRQQQDDEYQSSLDADKKKEHDRKEAKRVRQERLSYLRAMFTQDLEPQQTESDTTQLQIRLPSGTRLVRRFRVSDTIGYVRAYIGSYGEIDLDANYVIVQSYPKLSYDDTDMTLKDAE